jgi:hypothetical protein
MQTVLLKRGGGEGKKFPAGQQIEFTVQELIDAAGLDECCTESDEKPGPVVMDQGYTRSEGGVFGNTSDPTPRLTGIVFVFQLDYTNENHCRIDLSHDKVDVSKEKGDINAVACLSVRARRQWTQVRRKSYLLPFADGSRIERTYSGILIDFKVGGTFKFNDVAAIFRGVTSIVIWLGIPIWVLYFFAIFFLGNLSSIYNRVIHQELSLSSACVGLAGRLISHTSAFADVQDFPEGLSKGRLHERFQMIMQYNTSLDEDEVQKFVDFVYAGIAIAGDEEQTGDAQNLIDVQDFCTVFSANEPLSFDSLVKIFDKDRTMGIAETLFQDEVIRSVRSVTANDEMSEAIKHAMVRQDKGELTIVKKQAIDTSNAAAMQARYTELEEEIKRNKISMERMLLKNKTLLKQITNAEENYKKLGGDYQFEAEQRFSQYAD